uniref:LPXTG cell wall anchor domain-containing protein n=1 Tax=Lacticaseibacillus hulanensis TaxID=2493111 RepID=UPI000FDBDBA1
KTNAADDKGTTAEIKAAADKLQGAIDKAKKTIDDAKTKLGKTAPYSLEPDVETAKDKLQKLIDTPSSANEDITNATTALDDALTQAATDRDTVIATGDQTEDGIKTTDLAKNPAVAQAIKDYETAKTNASADEGTTAKIKEAADKLQGAIDNAKKTIDDAKTKLGETAPYSLEPDVEAAKDKLQKLIDTPTSSNGDINQATTALDDALKAAADERDGIIDNGDATVAKIGEDIKDNPAVVQALQDYNDAKTDAGNDVGTTKAIADQGAALQQAIDEANDLLNEANNLLGKTAPYSLEPAVKEAKDQLQKLVDEPTSTNEDINQATTALDGALKQAATDRTNAIADGDKITDEIGADIEDNPAVVQALQDYNDAKTNAAADKGTTQQIIDAGIALQGAIDHANKVVGDAQKLVADGATSPYSLEPAVKEAKDKLVALLDEPTSSNDDLEQAITALGDALTDAKNIRTQVITSGDKLTANIGADIKDNPAVVQALQEYNDAKTNAAADKGTTRDIVNAAFNLQGVINHVNKVRGDAQGAATDTATAPFSYEPGVAAAKAKLTALLADSASSTADLEDAIVSVDTAVMVARIYRETATDDGTAAVAEAKTAGVIDDPAVAAAISSYRAIVARAAKDNPDALTEDIMQAIAQIRAAVKTATDQQQLPATGGDITPSKQTKTEAATPALPSTGGTSTKELPQTGDEANNGFAVLGLLGMALTGMGGFLTRRRHEDD